jgi:hypothetical protein
MVNDANVTVTSSIQMANFLGVNLTGAPMTSRETGNQPVTFNVLTNNPAGYTVSVQAEAVSLVPVTQIPAVGPPNTDSIPIGYLSVRETTPGNTRAFVPMTSSAASNPGTPVIVHYQDSPSINNEGLGDPLSNDYKIDIPFVSPDTYTVYLNYIASTL